MLFSRLLARLVRIGQLTVIDADGRRHAFGTDTQPAVTIRLHDRSLHWRLFLRPELYVGEAWTDGTLTVEGGSIYDFLDFIGRNLRVVGVHSYMLPVLRYLSPLRHLYLHNPVRRAYRNAAHHYDLSDRLYELFLDQDWQYSCAYFLTPDDDLDLAQRQKRRHIAAKLLLEPGQRILDIGSGWGGLGLYLARRFDADVTGITLSQEQLGRAEMRAREAGLAERARFRLRDYREETGIYDRIVSVGMFEHVGANDYDAFFGTVRDRLTDDGVALLHFIGDNNRPALPNPWVRKYIFPGGYIPSLSEVMPAVERSGLIVTDIEVLQLHYAETLRHWRKRFLANREAAAALYDERFCRMWEFYLAASEMGFRYRGLCIFQMQFAKRQDTVPLTRDYIGVAEQALASTEEGRRTPRRRAFATVGKERRELPKTG